MVSAKPPHWGAGGLDIQSKTRMKRKQIHSSVFAERRQAPFPTKCLCQRGTGEDVDTLIQLNDADDDHGDTDDGGIDDEES